MEKMTEIEQAIHAIEQGMMPVSNSNVDQVKKYELHQRMEHYKVPGFSAALIFEDELVWVKGYGLQEKGSERPVTPETIFQAASISKAVTGMIALHLVEAGMIDLEADANEFMRSWKIPHSKFTQMHTEGEIPKVNLRRLLSHTAGVNIRGYRGYTTGRELPTLQQILNGDPPANSKPVRITQPPGKGFKYSGGGYLIVQQMIEDATGKSLASLAKEILFEKLGMTGSTFDIRLPQELQSRAASGHRRNGTPVKGNWHLYPEQAAASLWSTPSDLARLIVEVLKSLKNRSNLVLSPEMTRQMLVPQAGLGGLGFNVVIQDGLTRFGHPGWNEGFHSILLGCPEAGQGLVWMTNGENGNSLRSEASKGLADVVGWSWW